MQILQPPLFSPQSVFWRVNRELVSGLAGPRAVLMQIAHPLVAAGVADHSRFRSGRWRRLYRTAAAAASITFLSEDMAKRAIRSINHKHQAVHGVLPVPAGAFAAGTAYNANDPELKLWVLSTITDSAILFYEMFVAPLSSEERESYYRDSLVAAKLFGLQGGSIPQTYREFRCYMDDMLQGDAIQVSEAAREIAAALFAPSPSGRLLKLASTAGIGLLPSRLRREFGFSWSARRERWLVRAAAMHRRVRRHVPSFLCGSPVATVSELLAAERIS